MRSRTALRVLAVIGILALSATVAQAGGGGATPTPLTSFFVCHGISDKTASGAFVDVNSSFFGVNPLRVTIGSGVLACAFAKLFHAGSRAQEDEIIPTPSPLPGVNEQLKCYSFSASRQPGPTPAIRNDYDTSDVLLPQDKGVQANQLHFICAPATFQFSLP